MNYHFSKDYSLLWELAQKQEVICVIGRKLLKAQKSNLDTTALVSGSGFYYSETDNISHFIEACEYYKVQFLIPGEVEELVNMVHQLTGNYSPFPTIDVLQRLSDAIDTLLHVYGYDGHGYEVLQACAEHAKERIEIFRQAQQELLKKYEVPND